MNFYKHHIGDYAKKTAHLSIQEHGAYLLMLHTYYGTEKPLPKGEVLYRILRAVTKAERAAVDSIASQFWTETETGFVNGRAFEEIGLATQQADASRTNGNLGGRPKKTQQVYKGEPTNNLIQTPDSTIQNKTEPSAVPEKAKSKPKTPIPEDLRLSDAMREQALAKYPDADADEMFTQFRAHHEAHGKAMKSWTAAWTTWIGNAANFGYPKRSEAKIQWR